MHYSMAAEGVLGSQNNGKRQHKRTVQQQDPAARKARVWSG